MKPRRERRQMLFELLSQTGLMSQHHNPENGDFIKAVNSIAAHAMRGPIIEMSYAYELLHQTAKGPIEVPVHFAQCLAPPFNAYWMEHYSTEDNFAGWTAMAISAVKMEDDSFYDDIEKDPRAYWAIQAIMIMQPAQGPLFMASPYIIGYTLTQDGTLCIDDVRATVLPSLKADRQEAYDNALALMLPFFEAHKIIHAQNVSLLPHEDIKRRVIRGFKNHIGKPTSGDYRYHTLVVTGAKGEKTELVTQKGGRTLPIHVVRGNYATYTKEKPLFGHFIGRVFRTSHVKGKASAGVVDKDYWVKE